MKNKSDATSQPFLTARACVLGLAFTALLHAPAHGQIITQRWLTQWGTSGTDQALGLAVDAAGRTWVSGRTTGSLGGASAGSDLFLTPLSITGVLGTSVQRGGTSDELGCAAAVVGGSTVFSVGYTNSAIWNGAAVVGGTDAVAVGYSTAGVYQSTTRWGSTGEDIAYAAAGNATHLLTAGSAAGTIDGQATAGGLDAFLSKRTSTGALVWTRTVGTTAWDVGYGAAWDSVGNGYLTGYTDGSLPTFTNAGINDIFLARYDASGTQTLLRQWGSIGTDIAYDVEVDVSGNIYLTGYTSGALGGQTNNGSFDAFLTKLDSSGNVLWTRLLGGTDNDYGNALALDAAGQVWIGGLSSSSFAGHTNAGSNDAFLALYDSAGTLLDTRWWSTAGDDRITGLAVAPDGSVGASGLTYGTLGAANAGGIDAFAVSVVPEPTSAALLLGAGALLALRRRRCGAV